MLVHNVTLDDVLAGTLQRAIKARTAGVSARNASG